MSPTYEVRERTGSGRHRGAALRDRGARVAQVARQLGLQEAGSIGSPTEELPSGECLSYTQFDEQTGPPMNVD
jgi:hypothetical protein